MPVQVTPTTPAQQRVHPIVQGLLTRLQQHLTPLQRLTNNAAGVSFPVARNVIRISHNPAAYRPRLQPDGCALVRIVCLSLQKLDINVPEEEIDHGPPPGGFLSQLFPTHQLARADPSPGSLSHYKRKISAAAHLPIIHRMNTSTVTVVSWLGDIMWCLLVVDYDTDQCGRWGEQVMCRSICRVR
ncbi:hypothetical protein SK128_008395 [Halocaridina rubra]|uniref:Uncharacterized protein n=1 Tax=Halocaridina rubra TaxID=373956 RepID=A0AAN9ABZ6_HALRR